MVPWVAERSDGIQVGDRGAPLLMPTTTAPAAFQLQSRKDMTMAPLLWSSTWKVALREGAAASSTERNVMTTRPGMSVETETPAPGGEYEEGEDEGTSSVAKTEMRFVRKCEGRSWTMPASLWSKVRKPLLLT